VCPLQVNADRLTNLLQMTTKKVHSLEVSVTFGTIKTDMFDFA